MQYYLPIYLPIYGTVSWVVISPLTHKTTYLMIRPSKRNVLSIQLILEKNFGNLNETQEKSLKDVYQSSQHLLSLVNEILDVSKIEADKREIKPFQLNLKRLLKQSLSIIMDKAMH